MSFRVGVCPFSSWGSVVTKEKIQKCERQVQWGRWQRWGTGVKLGAAKMAIGLGETNVYNVARKEQEYIFSRIQRRISKEREKKKKIDEKRAVMSTSLTLFFY